MPQDFPVETIEDLDNLLDRVEAAQSEFSDFSQEAVDRVFKAAAMAANRARIPLAQMAVEDTGMGIMEDKVIKNHFASEMIYNKYKDLKTCGVIEFDEAAGISKVAEPVGIIAGVTPTTNPTSTCIFKCLLALKTRNAIVFCPHPRAARSSIEACRIVLEAAVSAGAPDYLIGWITKPSIELSGALMQHSKVALILATGGPGMVGAAYGSGHPALGVGPGNTPVVIDETADYKMAVSSILMSKTFDNGVVCASEQAAIVVDQIYEQVKTEFELRGAAILTPEQKEKIGNTIILEGGRLNAAIVGQPAAKIAEMGGVELPAHTKVLIAECSEISIEEKWSHEKLSPTLALYRASDYDQAVQMAAEYVSHGGLGHTSCLYTSEDQRERIGKFRAVMSTGRVLLNSPASQGAIGDLYNFSLAPSLTLGCGSWGGNSISSNVGPLNLLNVKTVAERRENMQWIRLPPRIYYKYGALSVALDELKEYQRCFIVTDKVLFNLGYIDRISEPLKSAGLAVEVFYDVEPDPEFTTIQKALVMANSFQPDLFLAVGGGSPMDFCKILRLLFEHPDVDFDDLAMRFMDIRKRVFKFPALLTETKSVLCCVPTTSGTGSEVTPFSVVTHEGVKYPLADYELTPQMAIVDPQFVLSMPRGLVACTGMDVLTHAIEAYVSILATPFTDGHALEATRMVFENLAASYNGVQQARCDMHYAACIAGMAFANAFLGVCHSMAHKLGQYYHIPHGLANSIMLPFTIRFNATACPTKQGTFPQYRYPIARERYANIARYCQLEGNTVDEQVQALVDATILLARESGLPHYICDTRNPPSREEYFSNLDDLALYAFDDQCTGANPRYPLVSELKALLAAAYSSEDAERLNLKPSDLM